ncbi:MULTISPECIES: tol-pal system-associated acyl-CoA thioesterase [unclassified Methylibium]|uniref:tol-pal system-associated acyl-CoA thioesterase n=1 Tax=unclassified Methylibium TaxID=2633235 RepID=UPI0006FC8230|nr:tol-pal system-associated acyl-CoA thioesterase [Methylibium sp. Root1272]KQW69919.1 4-hydroxybenzoyl-CoA thioesterase [Methylibium sp. Root1272]MDP1789652.1 tol-pal system-associated acyl-CoA thioesterase [Methylibium sp.]
MPISSPPPAFRFPLRVYWEDTDAGGVVFYANYLKFFERARTEWLRSFGFEQEILRTSEGVMFIVSETAVRYLRPARLDDLLQVSVTVREGRQASLQLAQQCWRSDPDGETLLAEGTIRIGCVDSGTFRPRRIPISLIEALA